jgi:hypothetical protein
MVSTKITEYSRTFSEKINKKRSTGTYLSLFENRIYDYKNNRKYEKKKRKG